MQRLDFSIPPFLSVAWVSDAARECWSPRLRRINRALVDTTLSGVASGVWSSRRIRVPGALVLELPAAAKRLDLAIREENLAGPDDKGPVFHDVIVQRRDVVELAETAGIPSCCRPRFAAARGCGHRESIWETAAATPERQRRDDTILVTAGYAFGVVWHKLLVDPFSYPLCHLHCPETLRRLDQQLGWMRAEGHEREAALIEEVAGWPVEWSASHGICEVRTPVVKIAYETDATDRRYRVQLDGPGWPALGAQGLDFPFRRRTRLRVTNSRSFQKGLEHGCQLGDSDT